MPDNDQNVSKGHRGPMPMSRSRRSVHGFGRVGNFIDDEILRQLQGHRKYEAFREMRENEPVVGAPLLAIENSIRRAKWSFKPADQSERAKEISDFFDSCLKDMDTAWEDVITSILTFLPYGFAPMEMVFKDRNGSDGRVYSKHNDGRIGWKSFFLIDQGTVWEWEFDHYGDPTAIIQRPPHNYKPIKIPMKKILLFRTTVGRGSPEGYSILRNAYTSFYRKKKIEEIEAVGIERDLAGVPVAWMPASSLSDQATSAEIATRNAMQEVVRDMRRNEQEGLVMPLEYDEDGNRVYELELLTTGGRRSFDTSKIIERYDARIAMAMLSDFILLGHTGVGSFALAKVKTDLFVSALKAWISSITSVVNDKAVPHLMRLNGFPLELSPQLQASEVEKVDLTDMAQYIQRLVASKVILPGDELEDYTRRIAGLPLQVEDDIDDERQERMQTIQEAQEGSHESLVVPRGADNEGIERDALNGDGDLPGEAQTEDGSNEGSNADGGRRRE